MSQRIQILEIKPYGYMVLNLTKKIRQFIPKEFFAKRVKWGLYEIVNPSFLQTAT